MKVRSEKIVNKIVGLVQDNPKRALSYLLFGAFIIRLVFVLALKPDGYYFSDTRHYDAAAENILQGGGFGESYNRSPLYPLFMAAVYGLLGHSFPAMRIVEAIASLVLLWLIFLIARRSFGETVAWISTVLAALFPHFILLTGILYSTNLFTILLAAALYTLILADEKESYLWLGISGIFGALSALTFPAYFFIFPFWMMWLLLRKHSTMLHNVSSVIFFSMVFISVLTPWTVRNWHKYGRFTLVRPVPHTAFPNLDDLDAQKERIASGFKDTTKYLKEHPLGTDKDRMGNIVGNYVRHPLHSLKYLAGELTHFWALYPDRLDTKSDDYLNRVRAEDVRMVKLASILWKIVMVISVVVMLPVFLFALIGLFSVRSFERRRLLLILTIAALSLGYSLIYAEVRYRIPIEPYVLMFMAVGLIRTFKLYLAYGNKTAINNNLLDLEPSTPSVQVSYRQSVMSNEHYD